MNEIELFIGFRSGLFDVGTGYAASFAYYGTTVVA